MTSILDTTAPQGELAAAFAEVDAALAAREAAIARGDELGLTETIDAALALVRQLITAYIAVTAGKTAPAADAELLDAFNLLVKGDPTWNAIRYNCRELVYYRNCIAAERRDALPKVPEKMAVRTARHIYLYMRTRAVRDGMLIDSGAAG
jgi:hypothetical protein